MRQPTLILFMKLSCVVCCTCICVSHGTLADALANRRSFLFSEPQWVSAIDSWTSPGRPFGLGAEALACRLPRLLEQADELMLDTDAKALEETMKLIAQLVSLQTGFEKWLLFSYTDGEPIQLVSSTSLQFGTQEGAPERRRPFTSTIRLSIPTSHRRRLLKCSA